MLRIAVEKALDMVAKSEEVVLRGDIQRGRGRDRTLLLRNNTILNEVELTSLLRQGFREIYIADGADETEDLAILQEQQEISDRLGSLTDATKNVLTRGVTSGQEGYNIDVKGVLAVMEEVLKSLRDNRQLIQFLGSIEDISGGLYQHLSRVCCLSIALGLRLQEYMNQQKRERGFQIDITDKWLVNLATGALFHDIGKIRDQETLDFFRHEPTFNNEDWERAKQHVLSGYEMLANLEEPTIRAIARNHHQRYDGTGFPAGPDGAPKKGEEIDFFSRLVAVCNVYDRLLDYENPAKEKTLPVVALWHLKNDYKGYFDPLVLREFLRMVNPFPKGDDVVLTGGVRAKVQEYQDDDPCRPVVVLLAKNSAGTSVPYKPINLSKKKDDFEIIGHRDTYVAHFIYDLNDQAAPA